MKSQRAAELLTIARRNVDMRLAASNDLLKAADRFLPRARAVASTAFAKAKAEVPHTALVLALNNSDTARVEAIIERAMSAFDTAFRQKFTKVLSDVHASAGKVTAQHLNKARGLVVAISGDDDESVLDDSKEPLNLTSNPSTVVVRDDLRVAAPKIKGFAFDRTNPRAKEWVDEHVGELIDDMSRSTRERVKDLVERTVDGEFDTHDLADRITELIGDESRAETIARTETMAASNGGQREAWSQALDDGLLNGDEKEEWITTPDDVTCEICQPMDGVTKPLDGQFNVGGELMDGPPAHPRCRCTTALALN